MYLRVARAASIHLSHPLSSAEQRLLVFPRQNRSRPAADDAAFVRDGRWHLLALSSHPTGGPGWEFFVDGQRRSQVVQGVPYLGEAQIIEITCTAVYYQSLAASLLLQCVVDMGGTGYTTEALCHDHS